MSPVLSLADFLEYLRQRDFNVGVEHLLRAQILIDRIDRDLFNRIEQGDLSIDEKLDRLLREGPTEKLKIRLAPLFAGNRDEQLRFYKVFDEYANYVGQRTKIVEPPPPVVRRFGWRRPALAFALLAAVLLFLIFTVRFSKKDGTTTGGSPNPSPSIATGGGPFASPSPIPTSTSTIARQATPSPSPTPPPPKSRPPLRSYVANFVAGLLLLLLYEIAGRINRNRLLRKQESKSPPFSWPLRLKKPRIDLYRSEGFFQAVRRLRRRRIGDYHRLHIPATIAATIRSLGYPSFRYKPDSSIPEYLILIDRMSLRDHQARLFEEMFAALKREGLYVTRFFYNSDPRHCFDDEAANFYHLSELRSKYSDHRLLIFGSGDQLMDPITGGLAEWVEIFSVWHDRAVFTPVAPSQWAFREAQLVTQFSLLPASVEGLRELANSFAPPVSRDFGIWDHDEADVVPANLTAENVVGELRPRLGKDVFQWLCACALYPQLQWHLTLQIGLLPCMKSDLVNEQNLLRLVRLPWFAAGEIPEDIRVCLTAELAEEKERAVRGVIIDLLGNDAPPSGTFAADVHSLELALQQWLLNRDAETLRQLRVALKNMPRNEIVHDQMLVRDLKQVPASPLTRFLPDVVKRTVYQNGLPLFGFKTAARFLVMLLLVLLASVGMWAGTFPSPFPLIAKASPSPTPTPSPDNTPSPAQTVTVTPTITPTPDGSPEPTVSPPPSPSLTPGPLSASPNFLTLPCPVGETSKTCSVSDMVVKLTPNPPGDAGYLYTWSVTGGRIVGNGSSVDWYLTRAAPGTYTAIVEVGAGGRRVSSSAATVNVVNCGDCGGGGVVGCPPINLSCPATVNEGGPLKFVVNVPASASLTFNWSISAGSIMSGQGTPSITVDTTGLGGQDVTATVYLGGLSPNCQQTSSCSAPVQGVSRPNKCQKFDEYSSIGMGEEQARLDNFAIQLQNDPSASAYLMAYASKGARVNDGLARANKAKDYLKQRGINPGRVKVTHGSTKPKWTIELWICPLGASAPF